MGLMIGQFQTGNFVSFEDASDCIWLKTFYRFNEMPNMESAVGNIKLQ